MDTRVLVTGGSGFIGTWVLRELLDRGTDVVVVDNQKSPDRWRRVLGDRCDKVIQVDASLLDCEQLLQAMQQQNITHVIHLAALLTPACQQDPWLGFQVNVVGSTALFEAARRSGRIRSISYASSFAVYGPESGAEGTSPNRPPSFYGAFKQSVDLIAEQYWRHFGIASVAIRPHVVYGPEREIGLTAGPSLACRAAANGQTYAIGYQGSVGYDYVEDVAAAFVKAAMECPDGATVTDLPGEQATTEKFVEAIEAVMPASRGSITISGPAIPANIPPHPNYITSLYPDWHPTSLKDGIRRTIAYYADHRS